MGHGTRCCKLGRTAAVHELPIGDERSRLDEQLRGRWLGAEGYPETSLRDLTDWFNRQVMRTQYIEQGRNTLDAHLRSDYAVLTDPDHEEYHALLSDLDADGIDGEDLRSDFVSVSTLYRHLTECIGAEKDDERRDPRAIADDKIAHVRDTARMYLSDVLSAWESRGVVESATEADLAVGIYLECPVCSRQAAIEVVRQRGYVCETHMTERSQAEEPTEN